MEPRLNYAAQKAAEALIQFNVSFAPVSPLPILSEIPGVLVVPFAEMAARLQMDRESVVSAYGAWNQDAFTHVRDGDGRIRYLVTYNQRLPLYMQQRALARELGHILLGHDGSRPESVRQEEALVFARHFICPRPLIRALQDAGLSITAELLGTVTGCYERCLAAIRKTPGVRVPPELNRAVKAQFSAYVQNFLDCQSLLLSGDESAPADFGTYMDGYDE